MTISTEQIFKEILDLECEQIPLARLAFFREELRNLLHAEVLKRFHALADTGFTKARLARRIGKSPEQVIRWLGASGNWTLDTASDLFIGMRAIPLVQIDDLANHLARSDNDALAKMIASKGQSEVGVPPLKPPQAPRKAEDELERQAAPRTALCPSAHV